MEQADTTRRRVLAAARELFLARGYAGATVAAVAQAAGVAPDTIYVSLGGKQGLLEGVLSMARYDPEDPVQRDQQQRRDEIRALADPHQRLRKLVELSCQTLARVSPVHAVLRGAADGHPFAAELYARMLELRLQLQAGNLQSYLGESLRPGLTVKQAAERYSALLSPELYHLLTVERRWSTRRYASWVTELLDHDLLG
ncbi:MAG TPA: TetR family transcriptional regulator [Actinomycetes bacterium]|nr:TetR family transcriptional regulator [Actinomycetes bacterium]